MQTHKYFSAAVVAVCFLVPFCLNLASVIAQDHPAPLDPIISDASDDAELAIASFKIPDGLQANLFAAEPIVANIVAFHVAVDGRVFVCETFRQEFGVEDNREHPEWLNEDLAAQTVQDRINYIRKHEPNIKKEYHDQDDRIRLLIDNNGDGVADNSKVYSSGYNAIEDGTGAGVLTVGKDVFYTNIPHLWRLRDHDNDGKADERKSLYDGFGVRFAFRGHDLHGLIVGPDRRLYFSIGDRGYNVSPEVKDPASGAVFSCELDGSDLQVFATGLRNPQELAFDDFGNLFTGDNNSDSGDKARWVYLLPGGDSGWRMYYQYLPDRGPFNREKIWHPYNDETPAYVLPPIANFADGPSGLAYYPGTGLTDFFKDRFFLCDFRGTASVSGIRSFRLKQKGAGFEIVDSDQSLWNILATDVEFGPDGKMYVSDWVHGWQGIGKGRIYTFSSTTEDAATNQVQAVLEQGLKKYSVQELIRFLGHADRRVRYAAQFELEDRGNADSIFSVFFQNDSASLLQRIHALWGFANLVRRSGKDNLQPENLTKTLDAVVALSMRSETELKAQIASLIGELHLHQYADQLTSLADDENSRVKLKALLALGKIGDTRHLPLVCKTIAEDRDTDPYLRHGAIMALKGILGRIKRNQGEPFFSGELNRLKTNTSRSVRLATVVALRKMKHDAVQDFLKDEDPAIVLEAARAIHDLPLGPGAMQKLAGLIERPNLADPLARRVINANFITGNEDSASALATFATNSNENADRRVDAVKLLGRWSSPKPLDYVLGDWRPMPGTRELVAGKHAIKSIVTIALSDPTISNAILKACENENVPLPLRETLTLVAQSDDQPELQISAMKAIRSIDKTKYMELVKARLKNAQSFPTHWIEFLSDFEPGVAIPFAINEFGISKDVLRRRKLIKLIGTINDSPQAKQLLLQLVSKIVDGTLEPELALDVYLEAKDSDHEAISNAAADVSSKLEKNKENVPYQFALQGGDAAAGRKVFFERGELSCLRCHTVGNSGGNVGPNLSSVGRMKTREYLLDAIVKPNKEIAEGFSEKIILTDEGLVITGIQKSEDDSSITLLDKDGISVRVAKESIDDIKAGQSSMPPDLVDKLTMIELRDLIEFLAQQVAENVESASPAGH